MMVWDKEAFEAKRKRQSDIISKLEIVSQYQGSESGDLAGQFSEFLQSNLEYGLDEDEIQSLWNMGERVGNSYFEYLVFEVASGLESGDEYQDYLVDLIMVNKELEKNNIEPFWPEGYTPPTDEELKAQGRCLEHPYEYPISKPYSSCEKCWRIYIAENPEKAKD